jgi:hypothetical protein
MKPTRHYNIAITSILEIAVGFLHSLHDHRQKLRCWVTARPAICQYTAKLQYNSKGTYMQHPLMGGVGEGEERGKLYT